MIQTKFIKAIKTHLKCKRISVINFKTISAETRNLTDVDVANDNGRVRDIILKAVMSSSIVSSSNSPHAASIPAFQVIPDLQVQAAKNVDENVNVPMVTMPPKPYVTSTNTTNNGDELSRDTSKSNESIDSNHDTTMHVTDGMIGEEHHDVKGENIDQSSGNILIDTPKGENG